MVTALPRQYFCTKVCHRQWLPLSMSSTRPCQGLAPVHCRDCQVSEGSTACHRHALIWFAWQALTAGWDCALHRQPMQSPGEAQPFHAYEDDCRMMAPVPPK